MSQRAPINTGKTDPLENLLLAMTLGSSEAIKHQEVCGQRSFVNSDTLPARIEEADRKALEQVGFHFLGPVENDPLFQYVEMPPGWKKQRTDHSMWSDLLDDKGRKRGSIFYKAAFYDRDAFMNLTTRYSVRRDYEGTKQLQILDGETVLDTVPPVETENLQQWEINECERKAASAYLDARFPDWKNSAAYWE
jgi:hypothetical protein